MRACVTYAYAYFMLCFFYLKTRAIFLYSGQITVPYDPCFGIIFLQAFYQLEQSLFLLGSSGIGRPCTDVEASFVTDADAVGIEPRGMCAHLVQRPPGMNHPVASDVVVIADVGKATGTVVTTAVVHGVTLRGTGGTTMNHYQVYAAVVLVL